jgi:serine protease Do
MDDILLLDAVERYLRGDMSPEEKAYFENLRKETPAIDQMVVEHKLFVNHIEAYGANRAFINQLHSTHDNLLQKGEITQAEKARGGMVVQMWNKYRRVTGIAASIAGLTAIVISGMFTMFSPVPNKNEIRQLDREMKQIKRTITYQANQLNEFKSKVPMDVHPSSGGTSFLIDGNGYLVTNAHVVRGSSNILVQNTKGQEFKATIVRLDNDNDIAILKIDDSDFKPFPSLPYVIRSGNVDLGEQIFTLGYPRDEIVYNEGYMSAKTGYNGDTITCQIAVSANPGNSGGPVLNKNGEVIGILTKTQTTAENVVFAIKSKNIFQALDELKKDTTYQRVRLPNSNSLRGLDRVHQVKQISDCVFMVKAFTK